MSGFIVQFERALTANQSDTGLFCSTVVNPTVQAKYPQDLIGVECLCPLFVVQGFCLVFIFRSPAPRKSGRGGTVRHIDPAYDWEDETKRVSDEFQKEKTHRLNYMYGENLAFH